MDIGRLRTLREVSVRQTMAAAADALFLTPSAVSQQISQLEEELGIQLTERRGRGIRLTRAGEVLVEHAERVLTVLDEAKSRIAAMKQEVMGELRVAAFPSIAAALLPHAIQRLGHTHPHLSVVIEEMEPADGLGALGAWQVDVAVVDDLSMRLGGKKQAVDQVPLAEDRLVALLPSGHPLAAKASILVGDLREEGWAIDSTSSLYGDFVLDLCRRAGFEPKVNARCRSFDMVGAMVASGCSVSVVAGLRLVRRVEGVAAVRIRPEVRRRISVAYRRGESQHPAVRAFVAQLVNSASEVLGGSA